VYVAIAAAAGSPGHVPVFYKIFRSNLQNTAIFNEIFGCHLARAIGLPVPGEVGLCPCRKSLFVGPSRCLEDRDPGSPWIRGVASIDENPRGVVQIVRPNSEQFKTELLHWEHLPKAAVFDEWVLNIDRNSYNVLRTAKNSFVLIDHEMLLGGPSWDRRSLSEKLRLPSSSNHLANFVAESTDQMARVEMMSIATHFAANGDLSEEFLGVGFSALDAECGLAEGTTKQVVELLNQRRKRLPEFMMRHLMLGQLWLQ
jgi:hypothetical protein